MKNDLKRHRLLKMLYDPVVRYQINELKNNELIGVSFQDITDKLGLTRYELELLGAEMFQNREIEYFSKSYQLYGLACSVNGIEAFAHKKYRNRYWRDILNGTLLVTQIVIPLASVICSIVIVVSNDRENKAKNNEIIELQQRLKHLEDSLKNRHAEM